MGLFKFFFFNAIPFNYCRESVRTYTEQRDFPACEKGCFPAKKIQSLQLVVIRVRHVKACGRVGAGVARGRTGDGPAQRAGTMRGDGSAGAFWGVPRGADTDAGAGRSGMCGAGAVWTSPLPPPAPRGR